MINLNSTLTLENNNFSLDKIELSEEEKNIRNIMVSTIGKQVKNIRYEEIKELQDLIIKLHNCIFPDNEIRVNHGDNMALAFSGGEDLGIYSKFRYTKEAFTLKNSSGDSGVYEKALHYITKILDILRGEPLNFLKMEIIREKDSNNIENNIKEIYQYTGKEADLNLKTSWTKSSKEIQYELNNLEKSLIKKEKMDESFVKHYQDFYNIADSHIRSYKTRSKAKGKGNHWITRHTRNEGHIIEAFQRHLAMNKLHKEDYSDKIYDQHVMILLWYSSGNTGWWQSGDIGYLQVKGNNPKLASKLSIDLVANELDKMLYDSKNFDIEHFKELFTISSKDLENLTDLSGMGEAKIRSIISKIFDEKGTTGKSTYVRKGTWTNSIY